VEINGFHEEKINYLSPNIALIVNHLIGIKKE